MQDTCLLADRLKGYRRDMHIPIIILYGTQYSIAFIISRDLIFTDGLSSMKIIQ